MVLWSSVAAFTLVLSIMPMARAAAAKPTPRCGRIYDSLPSAKILATTSGTLTLNASVFAASDHGKVNLTVVADAAMPNIPNSDNNPFEPSGLNPAAGDVYFAVHLLVANHGSNPVALNQIDNSSVNQQLFLSDGHRRWSSEQSGYPTGDIEADIVLDNWRPAPGDLVFDDEIGPGAAGSVWLAYDVPPTAHPAGLVYDDDTTNDTYQPIGFTGLPTCTPAKR